MQIKGRLYKKDSAAFADAVLFIDSDEYEVICDNGIRIRGLIDSLNVSSRIGNAERKIALSDGEVFASPDNESIDNFVKSQKGHSHVLHMFESNMRLVVVAVFVTVVFCFSFIRWGLPSISYAIADSLPYSVNELISEGSFDFLDKFVLNESELNTTRKKEITARFNELVSLVESESNKIDYTIYFRSWSDKEKDIEIPNALALPSGQIIITDKFVELASNQDEIDAVLLHEIGHVKHRHGLKMVVQSTIIATLVTVVIGDASGFVDMGVGLGSLLISSHYSRMHETEADRFAFSNMLQIGIHPKSFSSIMNKITEHMAESKINADVQPTDTDSTNTKNTDNIKTDSVKTDSKSISLLDYVSSHPKTSKRIQQANKFGECFEQGLLECPM